LSPDDTPELSLHGSICYYLTNCISLLIAVALVPLTLRILNQLYNNMTTIEEMGMRQKKLCCFGSSDTRMGKTLAPNEFDMGWLPNMKQVLGPHLWFWFVPLSVEMKGQGFFYPRIPDVASTDINTLMKDSKKLVMNSTSQAYSSNDFESDPKAYIKKAISKYSGNTFVVPPQDLAGSYPTQTFKIEKMDPNEIDEEENKREENNDTIEAED